MREACVRYTKQSWRDAGLAGNRIHVRDVGDVLVTTRKHDAERLLIYFGWAAAPSMTTSGGIASLFSHDTSSIVVRDPRRTWYNLTIDGLSHDADDLVEQLAMRVGSFPRNMITVCGTSMGGYAALLFGVKLGVGRIVACAPQVVLHPKLPHAPKVPVKYHDITSLVINAQKETKIDIWYGAESFTDLYNISHLRSQQNLTINAVPGSMHNVLHTFKRRGELVDFFKYTAMNEPFSTRTVQIPAAAKAAIVQAGHLFYIQRDFEAAIDTLVPVADQLGLSAVYCTIGDSYYRLGNYKAARAFFERAATACHENYDAHYNLGLTLEKLKKDRAAERSFAKALEFVPTKDGHRYAKLASTQYRLRAFDDALKNHETAIGTEDFPSRCHYEIGTILMNRRREQEALQHFEQHRRLVPDFKPTLKRIAVLTQKLANRSLLFLICLGSSVLCKSISIPSAILMQVS